MDLHDYLKVIKHGYSKVTDHACREVRHRRLTREEAKSLVQHHEHQPLSHDDKFCKWLGVDRRSLEFILNRYRNPNIWKPNELGLWERTMEPSKKTDNLTMETQDLGFRAHAKLDNGEQDRYIIIGKGYP